MQGATSGAGTAGTIDQGATSGAGATGTYQNATGGAGTTEQGAASGAGAAGTNQAATGGVGTTGTLAQGATGGAGTTGTTPSSGTQPSNVDESTAASQPATGGAGTTAAQGATPQYGFAVGATPGTTATPNASRPLTAQEQLQQLQARVKQLETEHQQSTTALKQRDQQLAADTKDVQQHIDQTGDRALDVEQARQQRLSQIDIAGQWMLAADRALERGEFAVDNAINLADQAFENIRSSAADDGQGPVVVHAERARANLNLARDAVENRDNYAARVALADAGFELAYARSALLGRESTGNVMLSP
ncbi:hypothetical protein JY651_25370 [Pyxidicoccus parkwayensis]|uniref:Uncharacterized protein n=1 Tax=Pyxidicoccus parkwayensis TaxID=2813578 RepID=A0ABX7NIU1_9BACT|nr:hypothetical protein [Pyxidicoccus parkwaysis]QSQ18695.1 hypothetical protein JY651_25370 [Pyxidicoccus parkwaysis]